MDRNQFIQILGNLPKKTALKSVILDEQDMGSYILQKIEYSVEKGERIRALIGIPKNLKKKAPAIFCHHQHAGNFALGKSEVFGLEGDKNQAYAHELAEKGYITFAPDAISFEERAIENVDYYSSVQLLLHYGLQGKTLLGKVLHDMSVGIDYLCGREDVDEEKIGFIGHSYGGRMALWSPAFDERIKVSVSNCGCINNQISLKENIGIQAEFFVFDMLKYGDLEDVVKLGANCCLYISATNDDKWSFGARQLFENVAPFFDKDNIKLKVWNGKHIFTSEMRKEAYQFISSFFENFVYFA